MGIPTEGKKAEKMTIVYEQTDTPDMEERIALAYDLLDLDYGLTDIKIDVPEIKYGLEAHHKQRPLTKAKTI